MFAGMREKLRDPDTIAILNDTKPGWSAFAKAPARQVHSAKVASGQAQR